MFCRRKFKHRLAMYSVLLLLALVILSFMWTRERGSLKFYVVGNIQNEECQNNPLAISTSDIRTVNIWDNLTIPEKRFPNQLEYSERVDPNTVTNTKPLTVLIVPHSHNDPGWLLTLEQYYNHSTRHIFDAMVEKLSKYPQMRMVWAETVFLAMWFENTSAQNRRTLKWLVDNGQLDIVTGGWVMPDEASTHYYSIVDQLIEGHLWLKKNLKVTPRIHWSIDPFGHSGTVPYLWHLAHFDGMVVQRVHQVIKDYLGKQKQLQFHWRQSWDSQGKQDIFCHMMPYLSYDSSATCGPDSTVCRLFTFREHGPRNVGAPGSERYEQNMLKYLEPLYKQFRLKAENFNGDIIFIPVGGDFHWNNLHEWDRQYASYMSIMSFMNSRPEWNIKVRFGTVSEYFNLIGRAATPVPYPTVSGDFFVYSDVRGQYWSGYFTSRPLDKALGREIQSLLKTADILHMMALLSVPDKYGQQSQESHKLLETARRDLALFQHHDAITGTAKPFVVKDYEARLSTAFTNLQNVIKIAMLNLLSTSISFVIPFQINVKTMPDTFDAFHEHSIPIKMESSVTSVAVFNPLPFRRTEVISVITDNYEIDVHIASGSQSIIQHQVSPIFKDGHVSSSSFEISFLADVPAWSSVSYNLVKNSAKNVSFATVFGFPAKGTEEKHKTPFEAQNSIKTKSIILENACLKITLSAKNGMITEIFDKQKNVAMPTEMGMFSYTPSHYTGAYLFAPANDTPKDLTIDPISVVYISGSLFSYVQVKHSLFTTTIKLYNTTRDQLACSAVRVDNIATLKYSQGDELVMRFNTNIQNQEVLYTDGNGVNMVKHRRFPKLPLPAAFYPMTIMAAIQDNEKRFTIHSAQPHGVASLKSGSIEVMLDRTFSSDDGKGLGEGIRKNNPAPSRFFVLIENGVGGTNSQTDYFHPTLESLRLSDILQYSLYSVNYGESGQLRTTFNPNILPLPCDAHVLSFRALPCEKDDILTTAFIVHRRGYECSTMSDSILCQYSWKKLRLHSLFGSTRPIAIREMSLSYTDVKKSLNIHDSLQLDSMDIRSYAIDWKTKSSR